MDRPSPGLQMNHGFLRKIEHNQYCHDKRIKENATRRRDIAKMARRVTMAPPPKNSKPAMEIYRPPGRRTPDQNGLVVTLTLLENDDAHWLPEVRSNSNYENRPKSPSTKTTTTIMHGLSKSRSMTATNKVRFQDPLPEQNTIKNHSIRTTSGDVRSGNASAAMSTSPPTMAVPTSTSSSCNFGLSKSKSLGHADMKLLLSPELDISSFSVQIQLAIMKAIDDPNKLQARQLMEIVRHLFNRILQGVRYAEPIASLCVLIIEREKMETFIETLLNSCRQWFLERDLFSAQSTMTTKPNRWVAYVTFLFELYSRLKSRKRSRDGVASATCGNDTLPSALILTLLGECCLLFLKPASPIGHSEIECLFLVITAIGKDLQNEHPQRMSQLMNAARDAFVAPTTPNWARKTLLQLIEMSASNWQLASSALAYYYPNRR